MTRILGILILTLGLTVPAAAQSRERGPDEVPKGHRPPPGMCRIWINGVPPGQQPEPTDCATAVRERPAGARVIFGDRDGDDDKDRKRPGVTKSLRGEDERGRRDEDERRGRRGGEDDDPSLRRPGSWPEMTSAIALTQGRRTDDVRRWLGSSGTSVRYDDVDGDRRPERATWFDRAGQIVQVWVDLDRDGFADSIKLYRDGKLIRVYEK